jgi:CubicO group peptidase (beta-lactamase class C family)
VRYLLDRIDRTQAAVDEIFGRRVAEHRAPSSVYAVFDRSGLVYSNGFGEQSVGGRPPTMDTGYRIASCTKSFTAAAVLLLRDRGLLSLDDSITDFLPETPMIGVGPVSPTIGQLLAMAGGLPSDDPWADRQESLTDQQFDALLGSGIRFVRAPGVRFEYSNLGFAMLGRVIRKASGRQYVDVVTDELLEPLELTGIGYHSTVPVPGGLAIGCRRIDDGWAELPFSGPGAFSPIGGLFATPRALARWAGWLASAVSGSGMANPVLSAESRRQMQTIVTPIDGPGLPHGYGYGLFVQEQLRHGRIAAHSGGYPGFGAHMRWHPDSGIGIVAMENATYSGPFAAATAALTVILDETAVPAEVPQLWPETLAARRQVESLLRHWDPAIAVALFADNVELDDAVVRRRTAIEELAVAAGIAQATGPATVAEPADNGDHRPLPLEQISPQSDSPAHLIWTVPGTRGSLRCEIRLTPQQPPLVQTLKVRPG